MAARKKLPPGEIADLLDILKNRFEGNLIRHAGIEWNSVLKRLESNGDRLYALFEMERTGGEPDVVGQDKKTGEYIFFDCAPESPVERRSLCYDQQALEERKRNKPRRSAMEMANEMGIEILTEEQYRQLQQYGKFDTKTSSWINTPPAIRELGGALFADFRYNTVFVYHNSAPSYFASRGFRGALRI